MSYKEMTEKQIENWRRVLLRVVGPFALIMPEQMIYAFRDKMQEHANSLSVSEENSEWLEVPVCKCDPEKQGYTRHLDGSITCNKCKKTREQSDKGNNA